MQIAELSLRSEQEEVISRESEWLSLELKVEIAMAQAERNKIMRYEERNSYREKLEKIHAGNAIAAAGRSLAENSWHANSREK